MSYKIEDIVKVTNPLRSEYKKQMCIIYDVNDKILEIESRKHDNDIFFNILFSDKTKIFSPSPVILKRNYFVNYFNIPVNHIQLEDYRYLIVCHKNEFLIFKLDFKNSFYIENQINDKKISFGLDYSTETKIAVSIFPDISIFYKSINKKNELLPVYLNGVGISIDNNKSNSLKYNFSEIKSKSEIENIFIILQNWESVYKEKRSLIEGFINKLRINKIKLIFKYDNMIDEKADDLISILKLRNGKPLSQNNKIFIDYFNKNGQKELLEVYTHFFDLGVEGLYLNPIIPNINNIDIYDKIVARNQSKIIPFCKNVQLGIKIFSIFLKDNFTKVKDKTKTFFSNIISPAAEQIIYIKEFTDDIKESVLLMENYYKQGFFKFAYFINKKSYKNLILILFIRIIIFDIEFLIDILESAKTRNEFKYLFQMREKIGYVIDNSINNYIKKGLLPLKTYLQKDKFKGILVGEDFYCAVIDEGIVNKKISLPDGKWYNYENSLFINGNKDFICRGIQDKILFFQKINSIHILNNSFNNSLNKDIFFNFYPDIEKIEQKIYKTDFIERRIINDSEKIIMHSFTVEYKKNVLLNYKSDSDDNINRSLFFYIIIDKNKIDKIFCNKKRIIYKRNDKNKFIEFDVFNKSNKLEIEIFMLK